MFTVTFVLYEKSGSDRAEALRYWRQTHGPLVGTVPRVQRYVQQQRWRPRRVSGVASLSFADQDAFGTAAASPEFAAALADVGNFADAQRLPTAFVEEVVIVG